jgi:hypothetical protein
MLFKYSSGEKAKAGDRIKNHGEPGEVEFLVSEPTGDPARDWYLDEFPTGGVMIAASGFRRVFLEAGEDHEDLQFVARG